MLHLHNGEELHEWSDEEVRVDWQMPPLGMQQAVHTLRALGVRVVGCEQEADALIVAEARRVCAFAVLGRDSDFFVFTGARYVPIDFLSFDGEDCIRIVDASAMEPPEHAMRDRLVQAVKAQGGTIARTQVGQVYAKEKKAMDRFESLPTKFSKFLEQSCAGFLESTSMERMDRFRQRKRRQRIASKAFPPRFQSFWNRAVLGYSSPQCRWWLSEAHLIKLENLPGFGTLLYLLWKGSR